jgi:GNAT superfamily N-acetyltransferase
MCLPCPTQSEKELLSNPVEVPVEGRDRFFVVERQEEIIGHFFLWDQSHTNKWVQVIGAFVAACDEEEAEGACRLFFDLMFQQKHMHKIILVIHPDAVFFFNIARALGLFLEGTLRKQVALETSWYDVCIFSVLSTDLIHKEALPTKDLRYDGLISRAQYDEVDILVVRAVILRMRPKQIEVLLLRRTKNVDLPGVEETPGGRMLEGETIIQALGRQVKETTSLDIEKEATFLTSFDFTSVEGKRVREFVFRVKPTTWDVSLHGDEYGSFCWLPLQDLPSTKLHPDMVQILSSYSPTVSYETELSLPHEGEATIELIRPPSQKLREALITGLHLDAYAARGLSAVDTIGFSLVDGTNKIVGGVIIDLAYGCLIIKRLWIDPVWRKLGWGRKLMVRAESLGKEKGCAFALANVMEWEEIPFFQKLGYSIESQVSGFLSDARMYRIRKEL